MYLCAMIFVGGIYSLVLVVISGLSALCVGFSRVGEPSQQQPVAVSGPVVVCAAVGQLEALGPCGCANWSAGAVGEAWANPTKEEPKEGEAAGDARREDHQGCVPDRGYLGAVRALRAPPCCA